MTNTNMNEELRRGVGIFIRAFPNSHEILTNSINVGISLLKNGRHDVDAVGVAVLESFPDRKFNRFDNVQILALQILKDFMVLAHTFDLKEARTIYTEAVDEAIESFNPINRDVSVKSVNAYIANYCTNFTVDNPTSLDLGYHITGEAFMINRYLSESITHLHIG